MLLDVLLVYKRKDILKEKEREDVKNQTRKRKSKKGDSKGYQSKMMVHK